MTDKLFKPLNWIKVEWGVSVNWVASNHYFFYEVKPFQLRIRDSDGCLISELRCENAEDGKAQAEQHHLDSVSKDLIEVVTK